MPESTPKFEGEIINLAGTDYTVPALSLRQVREMAPKLDLLDSNETGLPAVEQVDALVDVLHAALQRNYPSITKDELLDLIDLGNMTTLIKAAMRTSGMVKLGEGKA